MLKIKDNVDLSILENYGDGKHNLKRTMFGSYELDKIFNNEVFHTYLTIHKDNGMFVPSRKIEVNQACDDSALDVLYDLINDGLVEKV